MADARSWVSPYSYVQNSPVMRVDPSGALDVDRDDWFQNSKTGAVYYNTEMRKGDEAMLGEDWEHLGENGMFTQDEASIYGAEISLIARNGGSIEYNQSNNSINGELMLEGGDAEKFMDKQGYDFKPILFKYHSDVTTEYHPEPHGQVTITHDNSKVESVLSSRYISKDLVLKNTRVVGNYKDPLPPVTKSYGPMYSIRDQSWTVRQNIYGNSAFGRKAGRTINWLQKNTPWKSAYQGLW